MRDNVKQFYEGYHDRIADKRFNSPFWIRRYAHRAVYDGTMKYVQPGQTVLDAGCGDGVLSMLMAEKGAIVTGMDLSVPNVRAAQEQSEGIKSRPSFLVGDAEALPFEDNSFDIVVSSHVIEHLPDPMKGLQEIRRVTRGPAVIGMPTCLNPSAWALLGGDDYWKLSKRSVFGVPVGIARTLLALAKGMEGPQEGYAGSDELPHVWRFPWVMQGMIEDAGFKVAKFEADVISIPYIAEYFNQARSIQRALDKLVDKPVMRYMGYGSHALCQKI